MALSKVSRKTLLIGLSLSLLMLLGATELILRHFGFGTPLLYRPFAGGYEIAPDQRVVRFNCVTTINHLGVRGAEVAAAPAGGVTRLLVLGDSVANGGAQVNDAETWPELLGAQLNAQVLNASAGGWALANEKAWVDAHGWLGAKWLVWEINENDLDQPFVSSALLDNNVSFPSHRPVSAIGEALNRYVLPRLGLTDAGVDPGAAPGASAGANHSQVMSVVEAMLKKASADKVGVTILYWDPRGPVSASAQKGREALFALAARYNVQIVRPQLNADPQAADLFRDQIHPNVRGNDAIAKALTPALRASQTSS